VTTDLSSPSSPAAPIPGTAGQDVPLAPPPRHRRRWLIAAIALGAFGLLAAAWSPLSQWSRAQGSVSASKLTLATVERGALQRDVAGEGRVVAASAPTLYAPHAGSVEFKVQAGDLVKRGQVLALVSSPELASKLAQESSNAESMQAEVQRAEMDARQRRAALQGTWDTARVDFATAENDLARHQKAFEAGAVSGMQVERAKDTLQKARITLQQAQSAQTLGDDGLKFDVQARRLALERQRLQVSELRRQAEAMQLRAPVDGQVGQLFAAERAQVPADAKLLSVIDLSVLEVQMQVPESFARELAIGMPGEISGNGGPWRAQVSAISPEVIDGQVAARLRFVGERPPQLRQNQRLSVRVMIDRREQALTVRRGSFVESLGGRWAYVVNGGIAEKRPVRLGASSSTQVEVLEGLREGEEVVISGVDNFRNADRVAISR
jgi:HlyD family secretion protein